MTRSITHSLLRRATFVATLGAAACASAASLGFKLGINSSGGPQSAATGALQPTDVAGAPAYAQANWNVLGRWGDSSGNTPFTVLDSDGNATGVVINWDATGIWSQSGGGTPNDQGTPDGNLMNSYDDSNGAANVALADTVYGNNAANKPLVYISGLSAWLSAQDAAAYDVVIYSDGDATAGRVGEYWLQEASGPTSGLTLGPDLTTRAFICDRANFVNTFTYVEVPATVNGGQLSQRGNFQGNYTVLPSLTSDSFLLRTAEFLTRSPINAIQIVPRATLQPALIDPLLPSTVLPGKVATFRAGVAGVLPMSFQWLKNGAPLADGGHVSGATTAMLKLDPVGAADVANYAIVVSNVIGVITSAPASLTLDSTAAGSYAEAVVALGPAMYWRFDEPNSDPASNFGVAADAVGGFNATYGAASGNGYYGVLGPQPPAFPGFGANNYALQPARNVPRSWATCPPLGLNTNRVTICAWINPNAAQTANTCIFAARGTGTDVISFGYANNANNTLGYNWGNAGATFNFASGLVPLTNEWSFVALVVDADKAVLYLYNSAGQVSATNPVANPVLPFAAVTCLGTDPSSAATPQDRAFNGYLDELAVFADALTEAQLFGLYKKGLGLTALAPVITRQPRAQGFFEGRTAQFSVVATGDQPLSYRWRKNNTNLSDGGNIAGSDTPTLTLSGLTMADAGNYDVVVNNLAGSATSHVATLSVVASNSTPVAYEAKLRQLNPVAYWRLNEETGTLAHDYWGGNIAQHDNVVVGVAGPRPPEFVGLEDTNDAANYNGINSATLTGTSYMNNLGEFSIVGWFNAAGPLPARAGLFGQNDAAEFGFHGAAADLGIWTPAGAAFLPQSHITPGVWYLVAAVGNATSINLYLVSTDGVLQSSTAINTTNFGASAFGFNIGGGGILDATGNYFTGEIDEVAFFNRALTVGELADLFGAALLGGALPPNISSQPGSITKYAGWSAQINVTAVGTQPLGYQWRKGGVALTDGGNLSGAQSPSLVIASLADSDMGDYDVIVSNSAGMATSQVATVTVITPAADSYAAAAVALAPLAYYRLNEEWGPTAYDYVGGFNGTYQAAAFPGQPGVQFPPFVGFETDNLSVTTTSSSAGSYVTAPFGNLAGNNSSVTFTAWIYPMGDQAAWAGLIVDRGGAIGGMNYNSQQMLAYTWNNNNANTYNFVSGLVIPPDQWSFVAVAISPTGAVLYLGNQNQLRSATNAIAHATGTFGNTWRLGSDAQADPGRTFNGSLDEVAIFNRTLSFAEIASLYQTGAYVKLTIESLGDNLRLTWPQGVLLEADELDGPWDTNPATSPYIFPASGAKKYYRVLVPTSSGDF